MARKNDILSIYTKEVEEIREAGLFKGEAPIASAQGARVKLEDGREVINMCANNYLGLGDSQRLIDAAKRTYDERGYGMASVRFICGTQDIQDVYKRQSLFHPMGNPAAGLLQHIHIQFSDESVFLEYGDELIRIMYDFPI